MKKSTKIIVFISIAAAIGGVGYITLKKSKPKKNITPEPKKPIIASKPVSKPNSNPTASVSTKPLVGSADLNSDLVSVK